MMQSILAGAIFVALVLTPCVLAIVSKARQADGATEMDVLEEGFI